MDPTHLRLLLDSTPEGRPLWRDWNLAQDPPLASIETGLVRGLRIESNWTFPTVGRARTAFAEWRRILAPGGSLWLEVDLATSVGEDWSVAGVQAALEAVGFVELWVQRAAGKLRLSAKAPGIDTRDGGRFHVLAWPHWQQTRCFRELWRSFAGLLDGQPGRVLHLCFDPEVDGDLASAKELLEIAKASLPTGHLDLRLHQGPFRGSRLADMARAVNAVLHGAGGTRTLPAVAEERRVQDVRQLHSLLERGQALEPDPDHSGPGWLPKGHSAASANHAPDPLEDLAPWTYPAELGDRVVVPGRGSVHSTKELLQRTKRRAQRLIDGVLSQVDVRRMRILDVDCDCAFWSAHYARRGARKVVGTSMNVRHLAQARMHWSRAGLLPPEGRHFLAGNLMEDDFLRRVQDQGPFDLVLHADAQEAPSLGLLQRLTYLAREVLVMDLASVALNGPLCNALPRLGWRFQQLEPDPDGEGRVTVLARRIPAPLPSESHPAPWATKS